MSFVVHAFGDTNKGLYREINEDNLWIGTTVFAVADGMGGHAAGEVASAAALGPLKRIDGDEFEEISAATAALADAVREANDVVIGMAVDDTELRGMGTTLTSVMVRDRKLHLAHVGDSRAYLLRDGMLQMLTDDHTLVNELVKEGRLTEEQAASHPQRSVITRAIGVESTVDVDVMDTPLELTGGDQVLLCSDGLTGPVSDALIAEILASEPDGTIACQRLIDAANAGGGPDNITCVLLRVETDGQGPPVQKVIPRATSDDDATAELGDPAELDARRLAELSQGRPDLDTGPSELRGAGPRRAAAAVVAVLLIAIVLGVGGLLLLNRQYFVGVDGDGTVGVYRGIQGDVLGLPLSTLVQEQSFGLDELPDRLHAGLETGAVTFTSLIEAEDYIEVVLLPAIEEADDKDVQGPPSVDPDDLAPTESTATPVPTPSPSASTEPGQ